jgi:hypothetical protein
MAEGCTQSTGLSQISSDWLVSLMHTVCSQWGKDLICVYCLAEIQSLDSMIGIINAVKWSEVKWSEVRWKEDNRGGDVKVT